MNPTAAATVMYAAVVTGLAVLVGWGVCARRGRDALGPRPQGDLPRTGWPVLIALPVWVLLPTLVVASAASEGASTAVAVTLAALTYAAIGAVLLPFVRRGAPRPALTGGRLAATGLLGGVATFGAVWVVGAAIQQVYAWAGTEAPQQDVVQLARAAGGNDWTWIAVGTIAFAPFGEEIFFRGGLLPALARSMPVGKAVLMQGAIFGAAHVIAAPALWLLAIPLALVGVINGWLYVRTGSLAAVFLVHAVFNAVNLVVLRLA